jgi:hypothetical protein
MFPGGWSIQCGIGTSIHGFFCRWGDVSWPLASRPEAVSLLRDSVDDQLVPVVQRMHQVLISPEGIAVSVGGRRNTQSRVQQLEASEVAREQKVFEESFDLSEASPDVGFKVGVGAVGSMVLLVAAPCEDVAGYWNEEDNLPPIQHAQQRQSILKIHKQSIFTGEMYPDYPCIMR